ncbi:topoisomerase DNA-binding C4 zinc finger domain-containing protein [Acidihalobacter prosperus]|uniref:topoisomerase DNA-binding C4 zinc finger domain-containing protein n=1 Tax=Acidihalobacter prosperus TaxID=160660 RepID=UPI0009EEA81D|nr:topoisomerase DNA-binding C4 zinc finger domain-containing protein [Acidihalobacter prosperus]
MDERTKPEIRRAACPRCGDDLKRVWSSKKQRFYWLCLNGEDECGAIYSDDGGEPKTTQITKEAVPDLTCPECGQASLEYIEGAKFGAFLKCPDCEATFDLADQSLPPSQENLAPLCPDDEGHGHMKRRSGRNGAFWGCRRFPECRGTRQIEDEG